MHVWDTVQHACFNLHFNLKIQIDMKHPLPCYERRISLDLSISDVYGSDEYVYFWDDTSKRNFTRIVALNMLIETYIWFHQQSLVN